MTFTPSILDRMRKMGGIETYLSTIIFEFKKFHS